MTHNTPSNPPPTDADMPDATPRTVWRPEPTRVTSKPAATQETLEHELSLTAITVAEDAIQSDTEARPPTINPGEETPQGTQLPTGATHPELQKSLDMLVKTITIPITYTPTEEEPPFTPITRRRTRHTVAQSCEQLHELDLQSGRHLPT